MKPSRNENSNRRSWESSKLSAALEEEETQEGEQDSKDDTFSVSSNKSPELPKKEDREGMFSKYFKKGGQVRDDVTLTVLER